jgi:hypothetical protein
MNIARLDFIACPLTVSRIAPQESYLDNGRRTTQQALVGRHLEGLKPADKSSATANHTAVDRPVLRPRLTKRNLCRRRKFERVKVVETPGPKGMAGGGAAYTPLSVVSDPPGV